MKKKNILFFFSDQHRGDWMPYCAGERPPGTDDLPLRMPNIRFLMEHGTTFTRAATNSPLCVPARACLALGQDYAHCGAWNNDFCCPLDQPTFYSLLRDGGYEVSGVGKFDLHKPIMYWGEHGWIPQLDGLGFTCGIENEGKGDAVWAFQHGQPGPYGRFMDHRGLMEVYCADHLRRAKDPSDSDASDIPEDAYADNWVTKNALSELRTLAQKTSPWFLMVNFSGPHDPWDVTENMKKSWQDTALPLPEEYTGSRSRLMGVRQNYAAMLENIDRNIGTVLNELKRLGQYEDTVILYSADHGEMLGDKNRFFKSVPYRASVHIPLVISGEGVLFGYSCDELVQLNDLAATITAIAGLQMPAGTDSRSLLPLATEKDARPVRDYQYAALYTDLRERDEPLDGYESFECYRKRHIGGRLVLSNGMIEKKGWQSIATKEWKYIEYLDTGKQELYDLSADPDERTDIADSAPVLLMQLRKALHEHFRESLS